MLLHLGMKIDSTAPLIHVHDANAESDDKCASRVEVPGSSRRCDKVQNTCGYRVGAIGLEMTGR
jgi:hypothetical protein